MSSLLSPKVPIVDERQPKCSKVYEISCLLVRTSVDSHFTSRKESMSLLISSSYDALFIKDIQAQIWRIFVEKLLLGQSEVSLIFSVLTLIRYELNLRQF